MRKIILPAAALVVLLAASACARFRVQELKASRLFSIPLLAAFPHLAKPSETEARPLNLTGIAVSPAVQDNRLYLPDVSGGKVRVFQGSGDKPDMIIADKLGAEEADLIRIKPGAPGQIAADEEDDVFVQVFETVADEKTEPDLPPERRQTEKMNASMFASAPSRIVHIHDGAAVGSFGQEGKDTPPFERILQMQAHEATLYVFHEVQGKRLLSVFQKDTLVKKYENFNISDLNTYKYALDIENIVPVQNGVLVSATLRDKTTFTPTDRRVYSWDGTNANLIHTIDDENDQFLSGSQDGGFVLANAEEGNRLLLKIYSPAGEYLNNRRIVLPDFRTGWREVHIDMTGRVLMTRIQQGQFEMYEWK